MKARVTLWYRVTQLLFRCLWLFTTVLTFVTPFPAAFSDACKWYSFLCNASRRSNRDLHKVPKFPWVTHGKELCKPYLELLMGRICAKHATSYGILLSIMTMFRLIALFHQYLIKLCSGCMLTYSKRYSACSHNVLISALVSLHPITGLQYYVSRETPSMLHHSISHNG